MTNIRDNMHRFIAVFLSGLMILPTPGCVASSSKSRQQSETVSKKGSSHSTSRNPRLVSTAKQARPAIIIEQTWKDIGAAKDIVSISSTSGKLFAVTKKNRLLVREADSSVQKWQDIGSAGNTISIAGARQRLYAVTKDNRLLSRDATSSGKWLDIGDAGEAISVTISRKKIFGITNLRRLIVRDATSSGKWKDIGDAGAALAITNTGGNLLGITKDSKLIVHDAIPAQGRWSAIADTPDAISMVFAKGMIFALTKDGRLQYQALPGAISAPSGGLVGVRIQNLPQWMQTLFRPRQNNRRTTMQTSPAVVQQRSEQIATKYQKIQRTSEAQTVAAYETAKVKRMSSQFKKEVPGTGIRPLPATDSAEEILRVLIFDGPLELTQTLTHEGLSYPLDNPSIRISPPSQYAGYIIIADQILIKENINTKGHDLVLIAKEISVTDNVSQISINAQPPEREKALQEQEGVDAYNGGDIIFLARSFLNRAKIQVVTSGGKGQSGGDGRPMSSPTTLTITKQEASIDYAPLTTKHGPSVINFQPSNSFYGENQSCWLDRIDPYTDNYFLILPTPAKSLYYLQGGPRETVNITHARVEIGDSFYPTDGKPGGYGGLPGKISILMPEVPTEAGVSATAETGGDGMLGTGGSGGEMTPTGLYLVSGEPTPLAVQEYINRYSKDTSKQTSRYRENHTDRFITVSTSPDNSLLGALNMLDITGELKISYFGSLEDKKSGSESRLGLTMPGIPYMTRAGFLFRCELAGLQTMWLANQTSPKWASTLGLKILPGRSAQPLPTVATATESVKLIQNNWYDAVYELVPEYPERLAKRADKAYRAGNFTSALPFYEEVVAFSNNSNFYSEELISDAVYHAEMGNLGLDYFGFRPETITPDSPSREVDLITQYSSAVKFFNESIRDSIASHMQNENFILVLEEFGRQHDDIIAQTYDSITEAQFEIAALNLDISSMRHEIDATHRANIRMAGLLENWINYVNDRVEKLKKDRPKDKPEWQVALEAFWNCIQFVASVVGVVFGYVQGLTKAVEAADKLADIGTDTDKVFEAVDAVTASDLAAITNEQATTMTNNMLSAYAALLKDQEEFLSRIKSAAEELSKAMQESKKLKDKFEAMSTTSSGWTEEEAIDFRNNVLLADQIGVSGGMTYLQIMEQMKLNEDMLGAKYLALEASNVRVAQISERVISLTKQVMRQEVNRRTLLDVIDGLDQENAALSSVVSQLNKIGQQDLDAMMSRLQQLVFQLKYLQLDVGLTPGRYDRFIESPVDVSKVLDDELRLKEKINTWIADNANIGRLKVVVDRASHPELGKLEFVSPLALENFSAGEYVRPSQIYIMEPLRETQLVQNIANAIRARLSDTSQLIAVLAQQYPNDVGPAVKEIVNRERQYHIFLNDPTVALEDREVVLAYALANGGVTPAIFGDIQSQSTLVDPLKSSLQKLQTVWPIMSLEITSEDVISIRHVSQAVSMDRQNPSAVLTILNNAFTVGGSPSPLNRFHIGADDVQSDIVASYDPDFSDYEVLGSIHKSNDLNVLLAVTLLYAGVDMAQLQEVANQYSVGHPVGDCIKSMVQEWANLRRSVLERTHTLKINIQRDDFMSLPNVSGTFEHRYLASRGELKSLSASLATGVVVIKLPKDLFEKKDNSILTINLPVRDQLVFPDAIATPPSFVLSDYHYNSLFGRSVFGGWELNLHIKGDAPQLPNIQEVELEIIYSNKK